jgi:multiple sugar transport system permease protein
MEPGAPLWPALPADFEYQGKVVEVYQVPMEDGSVRDLAIIQKGRQQSTFIDPENLEAGEIVWQGSWRTLRRPWEVAPAWNNYLEAWTRINFPLLFRNTLGIALFGLLGTVISSTLVAYGFARFRFPGRDLLFTILISTIFLPAAVTIVPTYAFFVTIGWVGTWLPLTIPHYFSNAYNVFLMRQYMLTIPREIDEAAQMDGANPIRILWSVILPQCKSVMLAVALFHLVFAWNDYFGPLLYLSTRFDLQPIAVALPRFNNLYGSNPPLIQAASLMAMALPVVIFFMAQRVFIQGVVVTGVEK